ncbi:hypothetical protein R1flu_017165 [Riccia fluitans]|uniref:Uncharacterized protein n=1 Tax=Riccia fluitans TaxID=41844 RepID=A0ABD1XF57_9MARC
MTNPCYDFALRPQSNIPNSYSERRHTPQRSRSPSTPSSQESADDEVEFSQQRSDRGRWKTDGRDSIAGGFEESNSQSCQCHHCVSVRERNSCDYERSHSRHARTARRPSSGGNSIHQQHGSRKHPLPVPKFEHSTWSPLQFLRRPFTSSEGGRQNESGRLNNTSCKSRSSSRLRSYTPSKNRDVRESLSPNRVPQRSSKVRSLRRNPSLQRKQSPRKSSPGRSSSNKTPFLGCSSRRRSYVDSATSPCKEKCDIACQTRRDEFPLTPEETPRASPVRRVVSSNAFYHGRISQKARPHSSSSQRRPSPFRYGAVPCSSSSASTAPKECCCSSCVGGWQEKAQCQMPVGGGLLGSCQTCRHGSCRTDLGCHHQGGCSHHQVCHQSSHHGACHRPEPSVRNCECTKCHPPLSK